MPNLKNIKRNTNNFSFTETVASLTNNREYKSGYMDLINGKSSDKTYFWTCLSAVGEEIGSVIYENVLNYINNVSNINTCKLRALTSIAKVLGVSEFAVLKNLKTIPEDVLTLMDIFSINRLYLLNINNFNMEFVKDLLSATLNVDSLSVAKETLVDMMSGSEGNPTIDELSNFNVFGAISDKKYEEYIEECFFKLLSQKVFQVYGNDLDDFVYLNLSASNNLSTTNELEYIRTAGDADSGSSWKGNRITNKYWTKQDQLYSNDIPEEFYDYQKTVRRYKNALNVPYSFNETAIVNNIEKGLDFLDNYQGGELSVLMLEINERAKTKFSSEKGYETKRLDTRYSYYNEVEVRNYVKFIDDMFLLKLTNAPIQKNESEVSSSYMNFTSYYLSNNFYPYPLDVNYSVIDNSSLSVTTIATNIEDQFIAYNEILKTDATFSEFIYNYYGNVFSDEVKEDSKLSVLASSNNVRIVARILKDICIALANIRETLKTQAQRNYMTGTKLLVEYILDEYLTNTLINTYGTDPVKTREYLGEHPAVGVQIQEYTDSTEYFNIGILSDELGFTKTSVNSPYYNDLKSGGYSGGLTDKGLVASEIRNFYLSSLNIEGHYISSDDEFYDFMSAVYEVGITKTYVGSNGALCIDKDYLDDGLSLYLDIDSISVKNDFTDADYNYFKNNWYIESAEGYRTLNFEVLSNYLEDISSDLSVISTDINAYNEALSIKIAQQTEIMLKYHGRNVAYYPWYNYKNQDFATFQAHPYLYNFIEHDPTLYPIENAFYGNANEDLIYELQEETISVYLGKLGEILRVWRNSNYDYSGYKSRYENSLHQYGTSNSQGLYSVTHYDGIFYPPAIDLYKKYASVANPLKDTITINGETKEYVGFDLLSVHMTDCVTMDYYDGQYNLDIPQISSMWHYYSHLGLTKTEREFIVKQLINLSADILEMSDAEYRRSNNSYVEPYDIYKYGLDLNNNSVILLKRYSNGNNILRNDSVAYNAKKNTPGQLWIKFNSHPIGFPAFLKGNKSQYSNVLTDITKEHISWNHHVLYNLEQLNSSLLSKYGSKQVPVNVYDFDLAGNGKYLVYAIQNPSTKVPNKNYENSVTLASKIIQRKIANYRSPADEITHYMLAESGPTYLYPTNDGPGTVFIRQLSSLSKSDYEFDGYFTSGNKLYAGYYKRTIDGNNNLTKVEVNTIQYPSEKIASYNQDSKSFKYTNSFPIVPISTDFAKTKGDAQIKLGYSSRSNQGPIFSIVIANEIKDGIHKIQDFIGHNNQDLKISSDLSVGYGSTEYIAATNGQLDDSLDENCDSFDRFDHLISIYDIQETEFTVQDPRTPPPMVYALNSDASYIPLYYGVEGQNLHYKLKDTKDNIISYNKEWHSEDDNISSSYSPRESMELLGYSYQDFDRIVLDKEDTIYEDTEVHKYTGIDTSNLLKTSLRVYENFNLMEFVSETYNSGYVWPEENGDSWEYEFPINLPLSVLNQQTSANFNILLVNVLNGKDRNPILAGAFTEETFDNIFYDAEQTNDEIYILSTGYYPEKNVYVVGTPNPFNAKDSSFNLEYSNHILNIAGLSADYEFRNNKFYIKVKFFRREKRTFAIQSESLLLYVYKNTMDQFEKYHYMEPFKLFPYNAAISNWNIPWVDKSTAWFYANNGLSNELSNVWWKQGYNDYKDLRDKRNNYKDTINSSNFIPKTLIEGAVGNLPISAYTPNGELSVFDNRYNSLSLMENIELTSLTSFNDSYYLSSGQITWKISEEDKFDYSKLMYPPTIIDQLLYDKFHGINKEHRDYNIFELSNTYIFQLEDPLSIANKIGTIAIPINAGSDEFVMAYEDYLSDQISVDIGGVKALEYREMEYDPNTRRLEYLPNIKKEDAQEIANNELTAINNDIKDITTMTSALTHVGLSRYYQEECERNDGSGIIDYELYKVTPEEISDYLKIYVNWRKYKQDAHDTELSGGKTHDNEIELFFNYPDLFISPYSYKTKDGYFDVEYKPNTYLRLKSGEDGYLYLIFQFKYYDSNRVLCGVRDLPVLTYHIYNVSDDKPKFIITKTFEIDNRNGKYTYPGESDENTIYVMVGQKTYGHDTIVETSTGRKKIDDAVGYDYTLNSDLYLSTTLDILTLIPFKYLDLEMVYDRGKMPGSGNNDDPEFVFEPTVSNSGTYTEYKGNISAHIDRGTTKTRLDFTMLVGSDMNEETSNRLFPIEIMRAECEDINGNHPNIVFINGYIKVDDDTDGIPTGAYLARELNINVDSDLSGTSMNRYFNAGWIHEESRRALIRMYSIGRAGESRILGEFQNDQTIPLKTTGSRETRFDRYNDLFLLEEDDTSA